MKLKLALFIFIFDGHINGCVTCRDQLVTARTRSSDYAKGKNELFQEIGSDLIKEISVSSKQIRENYIVYCQEGKYFQTGCLQHKNACKVVQT